MTKNLDIILDSIENPLNGMQLISDKRTLHSYIKYIYEPILDFLNEPKNILEIGILHGVSIVMWAECYPKANIVAVDILSNPNLIPNFKRLASQQRIQIMIEDAYSPLFWSKVPKEIDLMIDDGPHTLESQIYFLSHRNILSENGILVIEDIGNGASSIRKLLNTLDIEDQKKAVAVPLMYKSGRYDDLVFIYSNNEKVINYFKKKRLRIESLLISRPLLFSLSQPYIFIIRAKRYFEKKFNSFSKNLD